MNTNIDAVLKSIPDFEEFVKLSEEIGDLSFQKLVIEKDIKKAEANIVKEATVNTTYQIGGKTPSMSFIENTYKYTGFDGELLDLRTKLAEITATLEKRRLLLSIYRDMLDVFRTLSANERKLA